MQSSWKTLTLLTMAGLIVSCGQNPTGILDETSRQGQKLSANNAKANMSTGHLISTIRTPTTPVEILQNIKFAMDHRLLVRDDFYTDEFLLRLFGGKYIHWFINNSIRQEGSVRGFEEMFEPHNVGNGIVLPGINIIFRKNIRENGTIRTRIEMSMRRENNADFESVEKIFGTHWTPSKIIPSPHITYLPPTRQHGNQRMDYEKRNSNLVDLINMEFTPDATLGMAQFIEEQ